ncbi:MAG: SnoaL-like protein [Phenylobacterium sp.]|nr:SnoaL-like protein [Phenylobacterium sp.]
MLLGAEHKVIGHAPQRVREVAEAHMKAYGPGDIEVLMATVSPRGGIWAGLAPPDGAVLMRTPAEIRPTYEKLLKAVSVGPPLKFVAVCTDWYVFTEGVARVTDRASGKAFDTQSIGIYGNDDLGTAIDLAWPFGAAPGARRPARELAGGVRSETADLLAHNARMAGWLAGDVEAASAGLAPDALLFLPCFDPDDERLALMVNGLEAYRAWLRALFAVYRVEALAQSNVVVGDQYLFSEHALALARRSDGAATPVRYALAEVLNAEGAIAGMLGFATRGGG